MKKKPPDDPALPPIELINEWTAKLKEITDKLAKYSAGIDPSKNKYIRNEQDMIEKMPFAEKMLELAFEHQELVTPEFLEKFWRHHVDYLNMKEFHDKSKMLKETLEELFPDIAKLPHKTDNTTTNG
jgi:hypothetical protein